MTAKRPRRGSVACNCAHCGASFGIIPAKAKDGDGKFCSDECRREGAGYRQKIIAAMPGTLDEIVKRTGCMVDTVRKQIKSMMRRGHCQPIGLDKGPVTRGRGVPLHEVVFAVDIGPPDPNVPSNVRLTLTWLYGKMILEAMPGAQSKIIKATGLSQSCVSRILSQLHADGKCFIMRWKKGKQGHHIAVFKRGSGKDATEKPANLTRIEVGRRFRERSIKSGHMEIVRERNNAAARTKHMIQNGDTLINALFGRPKERKAA